MPAAETRERSPHPSQLATAEQTSRGVNAPSTAVELSADSTIAGQTFKSPASWFQRSTPTGTSSAVKQSLLAMVPPQPLTRPSSATSPSPARSLQPSSLPELAQPKVPSPADRTKPSAAEAEQANKQQQQPQIQTGPDTTTLEQADEADPQQGSPVLSLQAQQEDEQQLAKKQLRRDKRIQKTAASMHWQLMRRLADISTDVEMLNHEVSVAARLFDKAKHAFYMPDMHHFFA